jgi:hypothetical protein
MSTKKCTKCDEEKDIIEYYKGHGRCKKCTTDERKQRRIQLKDESTRTKECRRCLESKALLEFEDKRHVCKPCSLLTRKEKEAKVKEKYESKATTIIKLCEICKKEKSGSEFHYNRLVCKSCVAEQTKEENNRAKETDPPKKCRKCTTEKQATEYRHNTCVCKECEKTDLYEWRKNNPEKFKEICKRYREKPDYNEKLSTWKRTSYKNDLIYRTKQLYRNRIRSLVKKEHRNPNIYLELLGCSYQQLLAWFEFNFKEDMTWNNMGTYWHIDHTTPCASYDFTDDASIRECFHWKNLAPMVGEENLSKANKINVTLITYYKNRATEFLNLTNS